jgi:Ca-activated chloride channel family protein
VRFAEGIWLFGTIAGLVVAALLIVGGFNHLRALRRFGDEKLVGALVTHPAGTRRAFEGVCLTLAVALAFVALAQPQYGKGTRLIPATNLDVVVVLDYSKSMYAKDVAPSRTVRAISEVGDVIQELPGARFGAVAFAGQPMSFPLTSDGAAIAQFFRGLSPNDMPVGGTAIARALAAARDLLARDPLSKKHERVLVLVTDGEDLEGDPVAIAEAAAQEGIKIHVVQVGGRTPEPIPEVNEQGTVVGWRTSADGTPMTTSLSAAGEAQLAKIAEVTGGNVVRSERGSLGIETIKNQLKRMMSEELSETVETVYADVYWIPLCAAIGLLGLEALTILTWSTFVALRRKKPEKAPPTPGTKQVDRGARKRRQKAKREAAKAAGVGVVGIVLLSGFGCDFSPDDLFVRNSPKVDDAIGALDAGDGKRAVELLTEYLSTGKCEGGAIGAPSSVIDKPNAGFDLGLGLFKLGEQFGKRFGEHAPVPEAGPSPTDQANLANRSEQVECALRIVRMVALDASLPIELRARAYYLAGNLEFLRRDYRSAVKSYDQALGLIPGLPEDAGDGTGRDAAYNRAIALQRIEEEPPPDAEPDATPDAEPDASPDAEPDAEPDASPDAEPDAEPDAGPDAGEDSGDSGEPDSGKDEPDSGDSGKNEEPPNQKPDAGDKDQQPRPQPQQSSANQDERMLDMLEQAPTFQQHDAQNRASAVQGGMEDK